MLESKTVKLVVTIPAYNTSKARIARFGEAKQSNEEL